MLDYIPPIPKIVVLIGLFAFAIVSGEWIASIFILIFTLLHIAEFKVPQEKLAFACIFLCPPYVPYMFTGLRPDMTVNVLVFVGVWWIVKFLTPDIYLLALPLGWLASSIHAYLILHYKKNPKEAHARFAPPMRFGVFMLLSVSSLAFKDWIWFYNWLYLAIMTLAEIKMPRQLLINICMVMNPPYAVYLMRGFGKDLLINALVPGLIGEFLVWCFKTELVRFPVVWGILLAHAIYIWKRTPN